MLLKKCYVIVLLLIVCFDSMHASTAKFVKIKHKVELHTAPSYDAKSVSTLSVGETAKLLSYSTEWYKIEVKGKIVGWIPAYDANIMDKTRFIPPCTKKVGTISETSQQEKDKYKFSNITNQLSSLKHEFRLQNYGVGAKLGTFTSFTASSMKSGFTWFNIFTDAEALKNMLHLRLSLERYANSDEQSYRFGESKIKIRDFSWSIQGLHHIQPQFVSEYEIIPFFGAGIGLHFFHTEVKYTGDSYYHGRTLKITESVTDTEFGFHLIGGAEYHYNNPEITFQFELKYLLVTDFSNRIFLTVGIRYGDVKALFKRIK